MANKNTMTIENAREILARAEAAAADQARQVAEMEAERAAELADKIASWARGVIDRYPETLATAKAETAQKDRAFHEAVAAADFATMRDAWLSWGSAAKEEYIITSEFLQAASRIGMTRYHDVSLPSPVMGKFTQDFTEAVGRSIGRARSEQNAARDAEYQEHLHAVLRGEVE